MHKAHGEFTLCSPPAWRLEPQRQTCKTSKCFLIALEISLQIRGYILYSSYRLFSFFNHSICSSFDWPKGWNCDMLYEDEKKNKALKVGHVAWRYHFISTANLLGFETQIDGRCIQQTTNCRFLFILARRKAHIKFMSHTHLLFCRLICKKYNILQLITRECSKG